MRIMRWIGTIWQGFWILSEPRKLMKKLVQMQLKQKADSRS